MVEVKYKLYFLINFSGLIERQEIKNNFLKKQNFVICEKYIDCEIFFIHNIHNYPGIYYATDRQV